MQMDDEIEQWLLELPLDVPIDIDGESVYLKVHSDGAELGAYLVHSYSSAQLQDALKQGFQSALQFDAGLGRTPDGRSLVLTQWLPDVRYWFEAAEPLERLLNQLSMWRTALASGKVQQTNTLETRNEQRLRMLLRGAKS